MTAQISWDTHTHLWFWYINDTTTGAYSTNEVSYGLDQTTADWIEEKNNPDGLLEGIGQVHFTSSWWADEASFNAKRINDPEVVTIRRVVENSGGGGCLNPNVLDTGGEGFPFNRTLSC
jgi:hypothetical protein